MEGSLGMEVPRALGAGAWTVLEPEVPRLFGAEVLKVSERLASAAQKAS
jgi:hypothetical protein